MYQQQGDQTRADDVACYAAEERLPPWLSTHGREYGDWVEEDMKTLDMRAQTISKPASEFDGSVARRAAARTGKDCPYRCSHPTVLR